MEPASVVTMVERNPPPSRPVVVVETSGFDALYRREYEPMVRLAYLLCGDRESALEVVHDAFVVTYERWDRLDRPGGYLRTSVVNRCRDLGRRRRFRSDAAVPDRAVHDVADSVLDAISSLPPKRRAAVVLRYYLDLSEADIADTLGVRPGTVKSMLHRSLDQLRPALAPEADPVATGPIPSTDPTPSTDEVQR